MDPEQRSEVQRKFMANEIRICVATNERPVGLKPMWDLGLLCALHESTQVLEYICSKPVLIPCLAGLWYGN